MWGPPDTLEHIRYDGKELEFKYHFYCKNGNDYAKAKWVINKLNKNKVELRLLPVALEHLDTLYKTVQEQVEYEHREKGRKVLEESRKKFDEDMAKRRQEREEKQRQKLNRKRKKMNSVYSAHKVF
jgi:hypothetical protein